MLMEEERLRREKDDLDRRYRKELEERRRTYEQMQDDNLQTLEDFWEKMHDEETYKWEKLMSTKPQVQYVERDDTLKLGQSLVDHLQHSLRTELTKIKNDVDLQEVDLQGQVNLLRKEGYDADKERAQVLTEIDQLHRNLQDSKHVEGIRNKYVYQTLLWDKLMN